MRWRTLILGLLCWCAACQKSVTQLPEHECLVWFWSADTYCVVDGDRIVRTLNGTKDTLWVRDSTQLLLNVCPACDTLHVTIIGDGRSVTHVRYPLKSAAKGDTITYPEANVRFVSCQGVQIATRRRGRVAQLVVNGEVVDSALDYGGIGFTPDGRYCYSIVLNRGFDFYERNGTRVAAIHTPCAIHGFTEWKDSVYYWSQDTLGHSCDRLEVFSLEGKASRMVRLPAELMDKYTLSHRLPLAVHSADTLSW